MEKLYKHQKIFDHQPMRFLLKSQPTYSQQGLGLMWNGYFYCCGTDSLMNQQNKKMIHELMKIEQKQKHCSSWTRHAGDEVLAVLEMN